MDGTTEKAAPCRQHPWSKHSTSSRPTRAAAADPTSRPSTASRSASPAAPCTGCSAPTAPASPRRRRCSPPSRAPRPAPPAWRGHDVVRDADAVRRRIGYVSQGTGADPLLSPRENLVMAARLRGLSRAASTDRAAALVDRFGLAEAADRGAGQALRRHAAQARRRARPRRHPAGPVPRRADHGARPRGARRDVGGDPAARRRGRADRRAHHALPRGGRPPGRRAHHRRPRPRRRGGLARVAQGHARGRHAHGRPGRARRRPCVRRSPRPSPRCATSSCTSRGPPGRLVARTTDGPAVVGTVIAALQAAGVRHGAVAVSRPTLDDVYLRHAGRSWTSADVASKEVAR